MKNGSPSREDPMPVVGGGFSLRGRLTLVMGGLVVLVLSLFSVAFLYSERRHISSQREKVQLAQVHHLAGMCTQTRINQDELALLKLLKEMESSPGFVEAMCLDGEGVVSLHSAFRRVGERLWGGPAPLQLEKTVQVNAGRSLWVYDAPSPDRAVRGGARVVYDPAPVRREVREVLRGTLTRLTGAGGLIVTLAFVLSWLTARALTRPIYRLAAGARRVGQGDWDTRVSQTAPGELGLLAREFNKMSEKLGELDRLKDQFVYAVSHDLRNPLGAILASAKMLRGDALSGSSRTLAEVIETAAARLGAMVSNILDIACLQERSLTYDCRPFFLSPLLRELVRLYEPLAKETFKSIRVEVPDNLPPMNADEEKVFRIFLNLLANAMKFTRKGDTIVLSARSPSPGWIECRVIDTGPGIAPERLENLFKPFQSRKGASAEDRQRQGSGLGLSLVKALIEGHGGTLRVESTLGQGASFVFLLPGGAA